MGGVFPVVVYWPDHVALPALKGRFPVPWPGLLDFVQATVALLMSHLGEVEGVERFVVPLLRILGLRKGNSRCLRALECSFATTAVLVEV